jgi:hypothetical protein
MQGALTSCRCCSRGGARGSSLAAALAAAASWLAFSCRAHTQLFHKHPLASCAQPAGMVSNQVCHYTFNSCCCTFSMPRIKDYVALWLTISLCSNMRVCGHQGRRS